MRTSLFGALGSLVLLFSLAITAVVALLLRARDRQRLLGRLATDRHRPEGPGRLPSIRRRLLEPALTRLAPLARTVPATPRMAERLVLAGYDQPVAPVLLRMGQGAGALLGLLAGPLLLPASAGALAPMLAVVGGLAGLFAPLALLDRQVVRRQQRIRHGLPDALDLLVVCVEAGISLELAIQRVGRELGRAHPALADELADMSRRLAAGVPREQAFLSLHLRTGVDELRTLATHLIQSERWGTSLAAVLRTSAQELRRRRRRAAEQRAATAATRMLAPLALCIFPTIFVVILGPAALRIVAAFREMSR